MCVELYSQEILGACVYVHMYGFMNMLGTYYTWIHLGDVLLRVMNDSQCIFLTLSPRQSTKVDETYIIF